MAFSKKAGIPSATIKKAEKFLKTFIICMVTLGILGVIPLRGQYTTASP